MTFLTSVEAIIARTAEDSQKEFSNTLPDFDKVTALTVNSDESLVAAIGAQGEKRTLFTIDAVTGDIVNEGATSTGHAIPVFDSDRTAMGIFSDAEHNLSMGLDHLTLLEFGHSYANLESGSAVLRDSESSVSSIFFGSDEPDAHIGLVQLKK